MWLGTREDVSDFLSLLFVNNYYSLASLTSNTSSAVLYYDYLLTLPDEINFFWYRRRSSVSILFFLNRYFPLLSNIPVFAMNFGNWTQQVSSDVSRPQRPLSQDILYLCRGKIVQYISGPSAADLGIRCGQFITYYQLSLVVSQIIIAVIMTLRTYALFGRSRRVLVLLLLALALGISAGVWSGTGNQTGVVYTIGCQPLPPSITGDAFGLRAMVAWTSLFIFDFMVFVLTAFKASGMWRAGGGRLIRILLRDGTIYFLVLSLANLSNILSYALAPPILQGVSGTFSNVISVTMVSRLIINIQNPRLFSGIVTRSHTRYQLHSSSTTSNAVHIGPFVTTVVSPTELSADQLDSQFSMDLDLPWVGVPARERGRGRVGRRLWYDLDPGWGGVSQRGVSEEGTEMSDMSP